MCIFKKENEDLVCCNDFAGHTIEFDNLLTGQVPEQQDVTKTEGMVHQHGGFFTLLV